MKDSSDGYGPLSMPPSSEAAAILAAMTEEEKVNFSELLRHLQEWLESSAEKQSVKFHPEARAVFWGTAFAKIADHYRDINRNEKALFFTNIAWNLSRYPVFAYNKALFLIAAGDFRSAKTLLETYLAEYRKVLTNPLLTVVNPEMTEEKLEKLAGSARAKIIALESQSE